MTAVATRDDRRARAEAAAERAAQRAAAAEAAYTDQPGRRIPLGQPILVGHRSQRRHERDLERLHRADQKVRQAYAEVEQTSARAAAAGYSVLVDDDDAVVALRAKLAAAEAGHAAYLAHNTAVRQVGVCAVAGCGGCHLLRRAGGPGQVVPGYAVTNARARIRQVQAQLSKAEAHAAVVAAGVADEVLATGAGWSLINAHTQARVRLVFEAAPDLEVRAVLTTAGFRWAPSVGAWQRRNTPAGVAVARGLCERLP